MNAHALFVDDDDEGLVRLAARSLARAGYRVSTAPDTAEARVVMVSMGTSSSGACGPSKRRAGARRRLPR